MGEAPFRGPEGEPSEKQPAAKRLTSWHRNATRLPLAGGAGEGAGG